MKINISLNRTCGVSWYQWTCFVKEYNLLCSIKWTIIFMTALSIITLMFLYRWLWKTWSIRSTWRNPRKLRGSSPQRSDSFIHSFIHFLVHLFIHPLSLSVFQSILLICMFVLFSTVLFLLHVHVCKNDSKNSLLIHFIPFEKKNDPFQYCYMYIRLTIFLELFLFYL